MNGIINGLRDEVSQLKSERNELAATVEALRMAAMNYEEEMGYSVQSEEEVAASNSLKSALAATPQQHLRDVRAEAVSSLNLDAYDAGHLNDFGGGNIGWWQDYLRSELGAAHDFYQHQIDNYAESVRAGE